MISITQSLAHAFFLDLEEFCRNQIRSTEVISNKMQEWSNTFTYVVKITQAWYMGYSLKIRKSENRSSEIRMREGPIVVCFWLRCACSTAKRKSILDSTKTNGSFGASEHVNSQILSSGEMWRRNALPTYIGKGPIYHKTLRKVWSGLAVQKIGF